MAGFCLNLLVIYIMTILTCALFFPFPVFRRNLIIYYRKIWSKITLFLVRVRVENPPKFPKNHPYVIASNHISYLDIVVYMSLIRVTFVAKKEVATWPIIGWIAQKSGTIFVDREKNSSLKLVNDYVQDAIDTHLSVVLFQKEPVQITQVLHLLIRAFYNQPPVLKHRVILFISVTIQNQPIIQQKIGYVGGVIWSLFHIYGIYS